MGNAYYTPDTTIVVGWGSCEPGITEIDADGNVLFEAQFDAFSYRAFRFPWRTTYFTFQADSMCIEYFENSTEATAKLTVKNPQDHPINLTGYSLREGYFDLVEPFPQVISPGDSINLTVRYVPDNVSIKEDVLTINSDINSDTLVQRIAQQIKVVAKQISGQSTGSHASLDIRIYPNPVGDVLIIEQEKDLTAVIAALYDVTGVMHGNWKLNERRNRIRLDHLSAGIYTLHLRDPEGRDKVLKIIRK
jgi:hypothetical protein